MAEQPFQTSVEKLRAISQAVNMLEGFMNNGMISREDFDKVKKNLNDKVHSATKELIGNL